MEVRHRSPFFHVQFHIPFIVIPFLPLHPLVSSLGFIKFIGEYALRIYFVESFRSAREPTSGGVAPWSLTYCALQVCFGAPLRELQLYPPPKPKWKTTTPNKRTKGLLQPAQEPLEGSC